MVARITIQIIMTGFIIGCKFYNEDNGISTKKTEPKGLVFWTIGGITLPITFMFMAILDVLDRSED